MKERIYLKIRIDLNEPLTDEQAEELVDELECELSDDDGRISGSEIVDTCDY